MSTFISLIRQQVIANKTCLVRIGPELQTLRILQKTLLVSVMDGLVTCSKRQKGNQDLTKRYYLCIPSCLHNGIYWELKSFELSACELNALMQCGEIAHETDWYHFRAPKSSSTLVLYVLRRIQQEQSGR